MAIKLKFIKTLDIKRGDGKTYELQIKDKTTGKPVDLTGYICRFIVKEYDKIFDPDDTALLSSGNADITDEANGTITITLPPEDTINFPLTSPTKPLVLAVQVANSDIKFSTEFHYGLNVLPNVFTTIY